MKSLVTIVLALTQAALCQHYTSGHLHFRKSPHGVSQELLRERQRLGHLMRLRFRPRPWLLEKPSAALSVNSADEWNHQVDDVFRNQPALRIDQVDLLEQNDDPLLPEFFGALRRSLDTHHGGSTEGLTRVDIAGDVRRLKKNIDAKEEWYLASQGGDEESRQKMEVLAGLQSWELPERRVEGFDPELRVPAALLKSYKLKLLNYILHQRFELRALLERERHDLHVKWEHKILRRTFDEDVGTQHEDKFHQDSVPEDLESTQSGLLCAFTVITVLKNHDPLAKENAEHNILDQAGTVFRLNRGFQSDAQSTPEEKLKQGDHFLYWYSRSIPGTATIFNNFNHLSTWESANDYHVTIEHSMTPQMHHSVADVKHRHSSDPAAKRSRTILQTKVAFCIPSLVLSDAQKEAHELIGRLRAIGLGPYLAGSMYIKYLQSGVIRRIDPRSLVQQ
eukprot:gnl/MRDRNA2_/MRDRNA2_104004_c0_seq1.p1 gnl/MRDRNA2_/MRDRNA2_104004_c0~~gnl/MRDRNA2_/MRDRNA2_104004_c0_seq1.p1  ORF type:complete len:449 (+),score=72.42 gnl/MRDRNA2_/MRDRNA2_104004_c0_seq1:203-1549(+)